MSEVISYATRLKSRMEAVGKTQAWVANKSGLNKSTISRLLSKARGPTLQQIEVLAMLFGDSPEAHIKGTDAEKRLAEQAEYVHKKTLVAAIQQMTAFESRVIELERIRDEQRDSLQSSAAREKNERDRADRASARVGALTKRIDDLGAQLKRGNQHLEAQRQALVKAAAEITMLRQHIRALVEQGGQTKQSSKLASILAGVAASAGIVTVGMLLRGDEDGADGDGD